jgi:hypothetical protein
MGFFRFRRSIKIAPGIRWNLGKRSSSISLGGKGFHYTVGGPRGSRTTVGIPGTGISYTETSGHSSSSPGENSGCAGCLWQIIFFILVIVGISMCTRSEKDSAAAKPKALPTATPQATQSASPTPSPTATPPPFPESRYWPKKVRLLKPVEFTGSVSGGTVRSTVSAGTILPASLSTDHQSVEVSMNDLSVTIPLADTDFLKRANLRKSRSQE